jgi:homoserine kinase
MGSALPVIRVPASSANLGPGFDVFGMALGLYADVGVGPAPPDAIALDEHHPAHVAFTALGGAGALWLRSRIPMARGLGFSGAVRVAGAALAVVSRGAPAAAALAIDAEAPSILATAARLEGHGDNVGASLYGGVVANVEGRALPMRVGPALGAAAVVVWIPDGTTSTDRSRRALPDTVERAAAVHNIARSVQLAVAVERDDPRLLEGATDDRLHQQERLAQVPGAAEAIRDGVAAGAWCGWLSGSGPTVALLCRHDRANAVVRALPGAGHGEVLAIDRVGARLVEA